MPIEVVELFEEHGLQGGELVDRGKLDHRLDLVLEQHRQHNIVARRHLEQRRRDRYGGLGHFSDQHAPLVDRALADQAFAEAQGLRMTIGAIVGIGRQQREPLRFLAAHLIDDALVSVHQRRQFGQQKPADRGQVALALQHIGEFGEVGL